MTDTPETLLEAVRYFSDPAVTFKAMLAVKWPDGKIACPKCGGEQIGVITSRSMLQCKAKGCRKQFSVKVGTFAEDSPLPLGHWLVGVWLLANKVRVTTAAIGKALGITQPSAWFMMNRLRITQRIVEMENENWRPVAGFEGFYEVSDAGRVRSVDRISHQRGPHGEPVTRRLTGKILRQKIDRTSGYCYVTLKAISRGIKEHAVLVHRAVLEAFVGPCPDGQQGCHFPDRRRTNNSIGNLRWDTPKENQADRITHGTTVNGEQSHLAKLTAPQVKQIRLRLKAGERLRPLAKEFGVDEATIGHIKHRRSWKALSA